MARKDYYLILGVPRGESIGGIRAAYHDLAKRHHPDVAGPSNAARFREIVEAYEVLSDPARRQHYNDCLAELERFPSSGASERVTEPTAPQPPPIFDRPESVRPSLDELLNRYVRNFTGIGVPKAEREEGLNIEVVLTPEEALRGGFLPITVPVFERCPVCHGTGEDWLFPCLQCQAHGLIESHETVRVRIPAQVRTGTIVELPLRGLGVHNFYLRVHIMIGDH